MIVSACARRGRPARAAARRSRARDARRSRRAATGARRSPPGRCASAPVCSRLPASPTSAGEPRSMFMCTSSRSTRHSNRPASISARIVACRARSRRGRPAPISPRGQHAGVRERAGDVPCGEALIEVDRGRVALDALRHRLGEAARPARGRDGVTWRGRDVGHGGISACVAGALCRQWSGLAAQRRIRQERRVSARTREPPIGPGGGHDACMPYRYAVDYKA